MKTTQTFPPKITQKFDENLLRTRCPLGDNLEMIWEMWVYIEQRFWKKINQNSRRKEKCEKLKEEFLRLYEQTKIKEESKAKKKNNTKEPFYFIKLSNRRSEEIFRRLRSRRFVARSKI